MLKKFIVFSLVLLIVVNIHSLLVIANSDVNLDFTIENVKDANDDNTLLDEESSTVEESLIVEELGQYDEIYESESMDTIDETDNDLNENKELTEETEDSNVQIIEVEINIDSKEKKENRLYGANKTYILPKNWADPLNLEDSAKITLKRKIKTIFFSHHNPEDWGYEILYSFDIGEEGLKILLYNYNKQTYDCLVQTPIDNPIIKLEKDSSKLFYNFENLETIGCETIGSWLDTSDVENMYCMFAGCSKLRYLKFENIDTSNVKNMGGMFARCFGLSWISGLENFDTSNVTDMSGMFSECYKLTNIDLSSFDTSNVSNFYTMFYMCFEITDIDISNFNLSCSDGIRMEYMFSYCKNLSNIKLDNIDTSNVVNFSGMFYNCSSLVSLDLSHFNTSGILNNISGLQEMFYGCTSLESVDISSFDTSNVLSTRGMFANCTNLKTIDLSSFDTYNVISMKNMFKGCGNLKTIYVSNKFVINRVYDDEEYQSYNGKPVNMFDGCVKLVGGNGTQYNQNNIDSRYACIDSSKTPGYFTLKLSKDQSLISFDMQTHGDNIDSIIVNIGDNITKPEDPTEIGWKFDGWYKESTCDNKWIFEKDIVEINEIVLYAKWIEKSYTVSYSLDGGSFVNGFSPVYERLYSQSIDLPSSSKVIKDGYNFVCWTKDKIGGEVIMSIASKTDSNILLYANWQEKTYVVNHHILPNSWYNENVVGIEKKINYKNHISKYWICTGKL